MNFMELAILFLQYFALAAVVVYASNTVGNLVDEFDNRTNLSGALLGGLVLAAVTSLPEFITSIASTVVYNEPGLAFGNIFGSNMFNLVILAVMDIIFARKLVYTHIESIGRANRLSIVIYLIILMPFVISILQGSGMIDAANRVLNIIQYTTILGFSLLSIAIIVLYLISAKTLTEIEDEDDAEEVDSKFSKYSMKVVSLLFLGWSGILVVAAYLITGTTNDIAIATGLNASFVGALFLGVATSLPELTTCYTLIKLNNFGAAAGGIVGSNIFNFAIIAVVDGFVQGTTVIDLIVNDPNVSSNALTLLILGLINSIILMLALMRKKKIINKGFYLVPSVLIITNYLFYLIISFI